MKKILSIILTISLLFSMAGCGGSADSTGSETAADYSAVTTPAPTPTPEPKVLSDTVSLSRYDEATKTYTNDYTGLQFTAPSGWLELDAGLALGDVFNSGHATEEVKAMTSDQLAQLDRFTDYCLMDAATNTYMFVVVENVKDIYSTEREYEKSLTDVFVDIFAQGKAILSGVEYNYIRGRLKSSIVYSYWMLREDGRAVQVNFYPQTEFSHHHMEAMFNGGVNSDTDMANVPSLHEYDRRLGRLINTSTGVELDVLYNWTYADMDAMAQTYYYTDGRGLAAMTAEQFAKYSILHDMHIAHKYNGDYIAARYLNLNSYGFYGLSVDELIRQQVDWYTSDSCIVTPQNQVEAGGHTYSAVKVDFIDENYCRYLLCRQLNEDYMVEVMLYTKSGTSLEELVGVINSNNDAEVVLQRSEYDESSHSFYNKSTDVTITVPADWYRIDRKMLEWLYNGKLTVDQLDSWTESQYKSANIVPDFAVASPDNNALMLAYYVNLNKVEDGPMIDMFRYYYMVMDKLENDGYTFHERDMAYNLNGRTYMFVDATQANGKERQQYAIADMNNEYALVLNYRVDAEHQDITDLMDILMEIK